MINLGTVRPGSTIYIPFDTFAGSTGAPITLSGLATSDILVYKDGGTTERASASGFTLLDTDGIDFDGKTGIHGLSISLADNTTAGFWAAGSRYFVVIGDVTVDSQTVRFVAATFDIGYPDAIINTTIATLSSQTSFTLTAGPAEDDALNGCQVIIHDVASAVQLGLGTVSDYTGSTKTVTLAAGTTFTAAASDNIAILPRGDVTHVNGVAASGAGTVDANVVTIRGDTATGLQDVNTDYTADASIQANVTKWSSASVATPDTSGYPKVTIKSGTGTGEVSLSSGLAAISTTQTWDGVSTAKLYRALVAMLTGKVAVTDNGSTRTLSFKQQDGTTESFTVTVAEADGARSSTGSIS